MRIRSLLKLIPHQRDLHLQRCGGTGFKIKPSFKVSFPPTAFLCLLLANSPAGAQNDEAAGSEAAASRIEMMIESGAYDFALRRIDAIQTDTANTSDWLEWEIRRFELYQKREEWDKLTERLLDLPVEVPEIKRHELMTHAAELLLESGRGERTREILRALIWRSGGDSRQLNHWRRLVVRSYIVDEAPHDAKIAMTLYDREYLPRDADWGYLFAQVLLRQGDAALAAERLGGGAQEPAARVLRLLSRLRSDTDTPQTVLNDSRKLRERLAENTPLRAATWAVSAEAASKASDLTARVEALEQLFNGPGLPPEFGLFQLDVADLWDAYEALGAELGNEHNLLFGDPEPWMEMAGSLSGESSALKARALNAVVARRSPSQSERGRLHHALYERLEKADLKTLSIRLYQSDRVFPSVDAVPASVRHEIVADAIDRRDIKLAARFARHLAAPREEQTQIQWDLTRARLALYAGDFQQSEGILRSVVSGHSSFAPEQADRIMQPIFDLQNVGRAETAFELFDSLYGRVESAKQQREILLWLGDARKSEGHFESAAEFYLRSAYARDGPRDQWGQTARYHAAEALAEAGLFEDARRLYEQILEEVGEGKRAAAIERRLQELWVEKQERKRPR